MYNILKELFNKIRIKLGIRFSNIKKRTDAVCEKEKNDKETDQEFYGQRNISKRRKVKIIMMEILM